MIVRVTMARLAITSLRLAVPLYLASVLLALGPAAVGIAGLASVSADRPWRGELLGPNWLNLLMELMAGAIYAGGSPGVGLMMMAGLVLVPLAMIGQVIAYSFLAGGILERLGATPGVQTAFWPACRRWFWRSFRLSVLGGVIVMVVGFLVALVTSVAGSIIGPDQSAILHLLAQAIVLGWLELARAVMVERSLRSVGGALRIAARAAVRPMVLAVWVLLALPPVGLLLVSAMPPSIADPSSVSGLLQALMYGQMLAFLSAWTKVVRLAVAAQLALSVRPTSLDVSLKH